MSTIPHTVSEFTGYNYNELKYNSTDSIITGGFVFDLCLLLQKCGIDIAATTEYDQTVENALKNFQKLIGIDQTGILTDGTLQSIAIYANNSMSDTIESDNEDTVSTVEVFSESPHYQSFFGDKNFKTNRKNKKDIKIVFGNNNITKTIKNVFMRSVTVEVDTSGNPIFEVYEFIAQDIKESDEIADTNKYEPGRDIEETPQIEYIYNFNKTDTEDVLVDGVVSNGIEQIEGLEEYVDSWTPVAEEEPENFEELWESG